MAIYSISGVLHFWHKWSHPTEPDL